MGVQQIKYKTSPKSDNKNAEGIGSVNIVVPSTNIGRCVHSEARAAIKKQGGAQG